MDSLPKTPKRNRKQHALTVSPYFLPIRLNIGTEIERGIPESPTKSLSSAKKAAFITFESRLPLGQDSNVDAATTVLLDDEDVEWYITQFKMLDNPAYAFNLRKSTYLNFMLYSAKPILIQERVAPDPWKVLVAVMLLNKTAGRKSIPIFWRVLERWPTPEGLSEANIDELRSLLRPLGLQDTRARRMVSLSSFYLSDPPCPDRPRPSRASFFYLQSDGRTKQVRKVKYPPTPISHLPGAGAYALDSYRIFCAPGDEWKSVLPMDKELIRYLKWKWAFEGCRWEPIRGLVAPLDADYLEALPEILS
ncbi:hypothetical protein M0805_002668 [Coniferiporia weirii]|nr:hypothetical protein M0805_002668 [Coniferiporia weirii]